MQNNDLARQATFINDDDKVTQKLYMEAPKLIPILTKLIQANFNGTGVACYLAQLEDLILRKP